MRRQSDWTAQTRPVASGTDSICRPRRLVTTACICAATRWGCNRGRLPRGSSASSSAGPSSGSGRISRNPPPGIPIPRPSGRGSPDSSAPTATRRHILIEDGAFPSDRYAVRSQIELHRLDPDDTLVRVAPRDGERTLRTDDIESRLDRDGDAIALVLLPGVQFQTGQRLDLQRITAAARRCGCRVGFDLAHAVGNVPLALHDWDVDFAVWCSYKYLNAGPGAVAGCFIHARHHASHGLSRLAGWWGTDPDTRFVMRPDDRFVPQPGAAGWQISTPPILALAPLGASLEMFDEVGLDALRDKSLRLTGWLRTLLNDLGPDVVEVVTPVDPESHGAQLSLRWLGDDPKAVVEELATEGIVCDFREPDVLRVAPVPLYNTFVDVWRFVDALRRRATR